MCARMHAQVLLLVRYQHAMEALEVLTVKHSHSRAAMLEAAQDAACLGVVSSDGGVHNTFSKNGLGFTTFKPNITRFFAFFSRIALGSPEEWAVSLTEHQAMLDEIFADPQIVMLVTGNIDRDQAKLDRPILTVWQAVLSLVGVLI